MVRMVWHDGHQPEVGRRRLDTFILPNLVDKLYKYFMALALRLDILTSANEAHLQTRNSEKLMEYLTMAVRTCYPH